MNLGYWEQIKVVLQPYLLAFISVLPAFGVTLLPIASFWQLVLGIVAAVGVYFFIISWFNLDIWKEAVSFYKQAKIKDVLLKRFPDWFAFWLRGENDA